MKLWPGQKNQSEETGGEFDAAAARVTAEPAPGSDEEVTRNAMHMAGAMEQESESLAIRPEWAEAAARLCFLPAARMVHPAYALADEEAEVISPKMQAFLQAVADKYAPAALSRVANKYPEFLDLAGALGVLYWQKWRYVSKLREMEAAAAREAAANSDTIPMIPKPPAVMPKAGDRDEDGRLVI